MNGFMKNVLANIVAIMIICALFFMFFIMMIAASAFSDGKKATVKNNSILTLDSHTVVIDSPTEDQEDLFSFRGSKTKKALIFDIVEAINKAKTDDKIKGISLESDFISAGMTQLDDIRAALEDFKKSGKFVYAYGNTVSQPSYYLGSVADQYHLHPAGGIELRGLSTEVVFLKNFTEKYGIGTEVIRHGKFKAAVEPYLRNDISPENREQLSTLLTDIWSNTSKKIAASRKIDENKFKTVTDSLYGIIPALSLEHKLADKLMQKSEYDAVLKSKLKLKEDAKLNKISFTKYISSFRDDNSKKNDQVAVLYASGAIYNGEGYDAIYAENYVKEIKELAENDKVKAVVFRINSPGGSANASDEILFELQQLKKKKPVIVSFGDYAASGGYYIAMAADKIYSEPNTLTGSIGVFGLIYDVEKTAANNGIRSDVVATNENANYYSPLHGVSPGGISMISRSIESTYERFVNHITNNRKKTYQQVDEIGGGRVWSGTRAKELGLVDELGTLQDAVKFAASKAKLKQYNVSSYPAKMSKFEELFKDMEETSVAESFIKAKIGKDKFRIYQLIADPKMQSGVMMETPYRISIK